MKEGKREIDEWCTTELFFFSTPLFLLLSHPDLIGNFYHSFLLIKHGCTGLKETMSHIWITMNKNRHSSWGAGVLMNDTND